MKSYKEKKYSFNILINYLMIFNHFFSIFLPALAFGEGLLAALPPTATTTLAYLLLNFYLFKPLPLGCFLALSCLSTLGVCFLT